MPLRVAFARFEFDQEGAAVVLDGAQFVEVGVVAGRDDAAVAEQRGGLRRDGLASARATQACGVASAAASSHERGAVSPAPALCVLARISPSRARLSRSEDRSRGRALLRAMRAAMRSMSAKPERPWPAPHEGPVAGIADQCRDRGSAAPAECRDPSSGWCRQWRSQREPMLVAQVSSSESRVGAGSPRRVSEISRLRRVAASRRRKLPSRSTVSCVRCASASRSAWPGHSGRARRRRPARALRPGRRSRPGRGCRSARPAHRAAARPSKCQSGRCWVTARDARASPGAQRIGQQQFRRAQALELGGQAHRAKFPAGAGRRWRG
jgi:hypothetical protein